MNPLECGYVEDDSEHLILRIISGNNIPDNFPLSCNCLKCEDQTYVNVVLNKLRVASSASVKLLNLVRIHLVILSEQNNNGFIKISISFAVKDVL